MYGQLRRIVDPDFGADIVECGFVKGLTADAATGVVAFTLELTTPVCDSPAAQCCSGPAAAGQSSCATPNQLSHARPPAHRQACPVKDEFERKAKEYVGSLPWVTKVSPLHAVDVAPCS